jgi:predicted outer membrane repeat protein
MLLSPVAVTAGAVIYVDGDSPGGDGSSWSAAFKYLQDGLAAADAGDEIRVAQGTYVPDQNSVDPDGSGDRRATFQLISGVAIYGGYAGYGEPEPDVRDVRKFETSLSGDLRGNDFAEAVPAQYATERTRAENSYNVVTASGTDGAAVLDGFTITAGQADVYRSGGGMYNKAGDARLVNCTFTRNWAYGSGGAIENRDGSGLVATNCRFIGNAAYPSGGAVENDGGEPVRFINCSFTGNLAFETGGAIYSYRNITLINCTLCGNSAEAGGGISIAYGDATLTNCIFWGNSDEGGTGQSAQIDDFNATIDVNFCCIQGWTGDLGGVGNTGDDPLLADADGADNLFGTIDDNPRLLPDSVCLNAGDNSSVPAGLVSDLDGEPRVADGIVDMGACEGVTQAILLTTEALTIPEGGEGSFGVSLAMAPETSVEIAFMFKSGDADIAIAAGITFVFDSTNYSTARMVNVSAAEDADYLHGTALIVAQGGNLRPMGVTVIEQDNEPTTGIVYVDDDATGSGDGMTWANAYDNLQDALHMALWHPQVWEVRVGQGIYRPDKGRGIEPGDREAAFVLNDGVTIKGGYAGLGAADEDAHDVMLYETILSGDLNSDDDGFVNNGENSRHVVYTKDTGGTAVLDGFTITGGNADGAEYWDSVYGGGILNFDGRPKVIDCKLTCNTAARRGGGMYNREGGPTLIGCTFSNNIAGTDGGGMYNHHQGSIMSNCIIANNFAARNGGGIGGDNLYTGDLIMTNCVLVGNEAGEYGGGMFEYDASELYLTNCVLWDNIAYEGPQMALTSNVEAFIRHCCFQGALLDIFTDERSEAHWGEGNIDADPLFRGASAGDYHLKSRAGRWDPDEGGWTIDEVTSSCIDAGDPNSDWTAELWPHGKRLNMGAFGGTAEASMSESLLGNRADLDNNDSVDFRDFAGLSGSFLEEGRLQAEDLNRDAMVDFVDILEFAKEWLWQGV